MTTSNRTLQCKYPTCSLCTTYCDGRKEIPLQPSERMIFKGDLTHQFFNREKED